MTGVVVATSVTDFGAALISLSLSRTDHQTNPASLSLAAKVRAAVAAVVGFVAVRKGRKIVRAAEQEVVGVKRMDPY